MCEIDLWDLQKERFENECDTCCVMCKQLCDSRCTSHSDVIDCDLCKYDEIIEEDIKDRDWQVHDINMSFDEDVLVVWNEICRNFNMDRLLLNYVEQNEFKLCIERGLKLIK